MFLTTFQVIRLPEPYASKLGYKRFEDVPYDLASELVAWLRREEASAGMIGFHSTRGPHASILAQLIDLGVKMPTSSDMLNLISNDGKVTTRCKAYLRRRFQFIDDLLATYPDLGEVKLPFSIKAIAESTDFALNPESPSHLECLEYLNPKDAVYYFLRSTKSCCPKRLSELSKLLSEKQKVGILQVRRSFQESLPLPNEGREEGYLAHILEAHEDVENLMTLFSDYPSYLTIRLVRLIDEHEETDDAKLLFEQLVTTVNYSDYEEYYELPDEDRAHFWYAICITLSRTKSKEKAKRLMSMVGARSAIFTSQERVPAPYLMIYTHRSASMFPDYVRQNLLGLFEVTLEEIRLAK